ncbi:MAG: hypothetical protein HQK76_03780 [Desulfobacterales bacterium]|nr:hypothetical protein [Desulfobacterales bacterium]
MNNYKEILLKRLEKKGMALSVIPGFIRSIANSISNFSQMNLVQINRRLLYLGWDGFELDYISLQLLISLFEAEGISHGDSLPSIWFDKKFQLNKIHHSVKI